MMLAITQPLRVGDWVTFEGNYGVVEDVRLNYTILRTAASQRIVIPNERLAARRCCSNETLGGRHRRARRRGVDPARPPTRRARSRALREEAGTDVTIAEAVPWGVAAGRRRRARAAARARRPRGRRCARAASQRLRAEGLLRRVPRAPEPKLSRASTLAVRAARDSAPYEPLATQPGDAAAAAAGIAPRPSSP